MAGLGVYVVLVDSNVFYSRTLRDWLALTYLYQQREPFHVRWTEDILAETIYHLRRNHPDWDGATITTVRDKIAQTFSRGRVDAYPVDPRLEGVDRHDAHVHAAAIATGADILLTCNTTDFEAFGPADADLPYELYTPDDFFVLLDDEQTDVVVDAIGKQVQYWFGRKAEVDLPQSLRRAGACNFAERVRRHLQSMHLT